MKTTDLTLVVSNSSHTYSNEQIAEYLRLRYDFNTYRSSFYEDLEDDPFGTVDGEPATDRETNEDVEFFVDDHNLWCHPKGYAVGLLDGALAAIEDYDNPPENWEDIDNL